MNLSTDNSKTIHDALRKIIDKLNQTSSPYIPISYQMDGSGCSCCRSEYFYLIYKIKSTNEYKMFCYHAAIHHATNCAIIRCSCDAPFLWKNITPTDAHIDDMSDSYAELHFSPVDTNNEKWFVDVIECRTQQLENEEIARYNEKDDDADAEAGEKNRRFYFL